jgi:amino acid transporter
LLTLVNIAGVRQSGVVQLVTTVLKFVPLVLIALIVASSRRSVG